MPTDMRKKYKGANPHHETPDHHRIPKTTSRDEKIRDEKIRQMKANLKKTDKIE